MYVHTCLQMYISNLIEKQQNCTLICNALNTYKNIFVLIVDILHKIVAHIHTQKRRVACARISYFKLTIYLLFGEQQMNCLHCMEQ